MRNFSALGFFTWATSDFMKWMRKREQSKLEVSWGNEARREYDSMKNRGQSHFDLGGGFMEAGRYQDALEQYRLFLTLSHSAEAERIEAQCLMGEALLMLGEYNEELEVFSKVWRENWHRSQYAELAYFALMNIVSTLCNLRSFKSEPDHDCSRRTLALIDQGLRWLESSGKMSLRAPLLLHQASELRSLGEREAAIKASDSAFEVALEGREEGVGYRLEEYCVRVLQFSRWDKEYQKGLRALAKLKGRCCSPDAEVKVQTEVAWLKLAMDPTKPSEALRPARRAARLADEIQFPSTQFYAYLVLARSAVMVNRLSEAKNAFEKAHKIVIGEQGKDRRGYKSEFVSAICEAKRLLCAEQPSSARGALMQRLTELGQG